MDVVLVIASMAQVLNLLFTRAVRLLVRGRMSH